MQASDPLAPRAVLGAVKAQPGNAGASRKPSATAGLDRPLRTTRSTLCGPGRRNGPWLEQRNCAISGASDDVTRRPAQGSVTSGLPRQADLLSAASSFGFGPTGDEKHLSGREPIHIWRSLPAAV